MADVAFGFILLLACLASFLGQMPLELTLELHYFDIGLSDLDL